MAEEVSASMARQVQAVGRREDADGACVLNMKNEQCVDRVDDGYFTKNFSMEGESTACHENILDEILGDAEVNCTDGSLGSFFLSFLPHGCEALVGVGESEPPERRGDELEAEGRASNLELQEECKRDLRETIQLCETLVSEKASVSAERDSIARELRALQEEYQALRQEKEDLLKDIVERQEMEEFRALEQESTRQYEKELAAEICSLKEAAEISAAHTQNLEADLAAMVAELKSKEEWLTELQALRHKDSAQEIRQLKRSLQDAEVLSRDARKEWAVLRTEAQALRESQAAMAEAHAKMEEDVKCMRGRLEAERSRFKEVEADLLKELQRTFQENDRLTAILDARCPTDDADLRTKLEQAQEREAALQARVAELEQAQEREAALQARVAELENLSNLPVPEDSSGKQINTNHCNHQLSMGSEEFPEEMEQVTLHQELNQQKQVFTEHKVLWEKQRDELQKWVGHLSEELEAVWKERDCLKDASPHSETRVVKLEEALAEAERSLSTHKEATQLLQTELQDLYTQLNERDGTIQALEAKLKEGQLSRGVALQRKDASFGDDLERKPLSAWNHQDVVTSLEPKVSPKQKVKEPYRTPVRNDQSPLIDSAVLAVVFDNTRGCSFQSPLMDKEGMKQLNGYPERNMTNQREARSRRRATRLKNRREPSTQQSPHTPTRGRCLPASEGRIFDSPKSRFFDTPSDVVHLRCPRQFFDNSSLGAISEDSPALEYRGHATQFLSPRQHNCKAQ